MDVTVSLEITKIIFLLSFLSMNSYFDITKRFVYGDKKFNALIGLTALCLIVYGYLHEPNLDLFYIMFPFSIFIPLMIIKKIPTGDIIAICIVIVILPSTQIIQLFSFFAILFAGLLFFVYFIGHNAILNGFTLWSKNQLFGTVNLPLYEKFFYFFLVHKKRCLEQYIEQISFGNKRNLLKSRIYSEHNIENGKIVSSLLPFMPFLLFASVVMLFFDLTIFPRF